MAPLLSQSLSLTGGPHSITAIYSGDSTFAGSISTVLVQRVGAEPTSTSVTASPNPAMLGQSVALTASSTSSNGQPEGPITFRDSNSVLGTSRLVNGTATLQVSTLIGGPHSITASYAGNGIYAPSTSAPLSLTVNAAPTQTALSSNQNPSSYGQAVSFSVLVSADSRTPGGSVTITDGGKTLGTIPLNAGGGSFSTAALSVGSHQIVASYSGSPSYGSSSSAPVGQLVNTAPAQVTLTSNPNPSVQNQSVSLRATVTSTAGLPDGTVTFLDGGTSLGTAAMVQGTAAITVSQLTIGQHSITANYSGSTNFSPAVSAVLTQTVNPAPKFPTVSVLTSSPNPSALNSVVTFILRVTSPNGGTPSGNVTLVEHVGQQVITLAQGNLDASGMVTFQLASLSAGGHDIDATYGGDDRYLASTSNAVNQQVTSSTAARKRDQTAAHGSNATHPGPQ
jgi:hypothetical protein